MQRDSDQPCAGIAISISPAALVHSSSGASTLVPALVPAVPVASPVPSHTLSVALRHTAHAAIKVSQAGAAYGVPLADLQHVVLLPGSVYLCYYCCDCGGAPVYIRDAESVVKHFAVKSHVAWFNLNSSCSASCVLAPACSLPCTTAAVQPLALPWPVALTMPIASTLAPACPIPGVLTTFQPLVPPLPIVFTAPCLQLPRAILSLDAFRELQSVPVSTGSVDTVDARALLQVPPAPSGISEVDWTNF